MTTQADERLANAKKCIKQAIEDLTEIIIKDCDGHDEYEKSYIAKIQEALNALIDIKVELR